jgi:hypothetical protein
MKDFSLGKIEFLDVEKNLLFELKTMEKGGI